MSRLIGLLLLVSCAVTVVAQHTLRQPDREEGERIYKSTCAFCHGLDGTRVDGVNLGSSQFRRASSDEDLTRIIKEGVAGTPMPASSLSREQLEDVVAYLHSMRESDGGRTVSPEVIRGSALFRGKGKCLECHQLSDTGGTSGPNLSLIGQIRTAEELETSILDPDAEVLFSYRGFQATTREGLIISGRLLNEDAFTVQVRDRDGRLFSLVKSDLREYEFLSVSPMPSYRDKLSPSEVSDVVAYLKSLKRF